MSFHVYRLFRDHNRHHCICVAVERKYTYFIPMEAAEVRTRALAHEEFARTFEPVEEYPVRRAAEIFLAAPDKEVAPEAREHLEAILADPAYVYDRSLYSVPNVIKENQMATKKAAQVAEEIAAKPRNKKEALQAAEKHDQANLPRNVKAAPKGEAAAPAKKAAKKDAEAPAAKTGGRAPSFDMEGRYKIGDASSVKRGFMLEFVTRAQELEKASRGKGFTGTALVDSLVEKHEDERAADATWVKTYVSYALAPVRAILVAA